MNLDQQIDAAHSEAERIEQEARQIEARIVKAGGIPPTRPYGRPVSGEAVAQNLTLKSLLQRRDPALASYLGFGSDIARKREEEQQARILQAETLAMKTEALRRQNQQVAQQRYQQQLAGINPNTGRRW
jgi:hypothetical protein